MLFDHCIVCMHMYRYTVCRVNRNCAWPAFKGTVSRDFLPQVFFFKQLLLAPVDKPSNDFDFFRIFAEIFDMHRRCHWHRWCTSRTFGSLWMPLKEQSVKKQAISKYYFSIASIKSSKESSNYNKIVCFAGVNDTGEAP